MSGFVDFLTKNISSYKAWDDSCVGYPDSNVKSWAKEVDDISAAKTALVPLTRLAVGRGGNSASLCMRLLAAT